jgi:antitoxin HigA-1
MIRIPTNRAPSSPGQMLQEEFLAPLGLSARDLARRIRMSLPRVNAIIQGIRPMTPDTALRLEQLLGVEAQFWLNLQTVWELYHARRSAPTRTIRRIRRLPSIRRAS